jgi:hypothetical protein
VSHVWLRSTRTVRSTTAGAGRIVPSAVRSDDEDRRPPAAGRRSAAIEEPYLWRDLHAPLEPDVQLVEIRDALVGATVQLASRWSASALRDCFAQLGREDLQGVRELRNWVSGGQRHGLGERVSPRSVSWLSAMVERDVLAVHPGIAAPVAEMPMRQTCKLTEWRSRVRRGAGRSIWPRNRRA